MKLFKQELKELLNRYGATLGVDIQGDTHGLHCDFTVQIKNKEEVLIESNYLDGSDL